MAKNDSSTVRLKNVCIEILDKIIIEEEERTGIKISYGGASLILTKRIMNAGGLKK